jgi:hypothetical protein
MSTPTIHELGNSFDERNVCLNVALGMISVLRRFKKVLRDHGSPDERRNDVDEGQSVREENLLLYGVLGLISFSTSMMSHLEATKTEASGLRANGTQARPPHRETRLAIRDLVR